METITLNIKDIHSDHRRALESVLGQGLSENQRVVINVLNLEPTPPSSQSTEPATDSAVPNWWKVYEGLDEAAVDQLDQAIRQRANMTRTFE